MKGERWGWRDGVMEGGRGGGGGINGGRDLSDGFKFRREFHCFLRKSPDVA